MALEALDRSGVTLDERRLGTENIDASWRANSGVKIAWTALSKSSPFNGT